MKICVDIDDYHTSSKWDCSEVIYRITEIYPDIKFTVFITPFMKKIPLYKNVDALNRLKELINRRSIEVFIHGLTHKRFIKGEFYYLPEFMTRMRLEKAENILRNLDVKYKKGIKFPWDIYSKRELNVIEKKKYILFTHRNTKMYRGEKIVWGNYKNVRKAYIQTGSCRYGRLNNLSDDLVVYYHGHAQNMRGNGIRESFDNFIKEIGYLMNNFNVDFIFTSELPKYIIL